MSVQELEKVILQLPEDEIDELMRRLNERREEQWDKQIAEDSAAGRLDHLVAKAKEEFAAGQYRKL